MKDTVVQEGIRIASFDVFDTTLTRIVAAPSGVFHLLQRRLCAAAVGLPATLRKGFPQLRMDAERQCRTTSLHEEITLAEIYRTLGASFQLGADTQAQLAQMEMEEERRALRGVAWTIHYINLVRHQGKRVIFVSDSYLPLSFIRKMLSQTGAWREEDGLYVSSEYRVMKASGRLFERVLTQEQCSASEIQHVGDNWGSDVRIPQRLGIRTVPFSLERGSCL